MKNPLRPKFNPKDSFVAGGTRPPGGFASAHVFRTRPEAGFHPRSFALLLALAAVTSGFAAITPTEWSHRQPLPVATPGLTRVAVPAATFDSCQPGLADLRLVDATGREISYLLDAPPPADEANRRGRLIRPSSFDSSSSDENNTTQLRIKTGTTENLEAIDLESSAPFFLKAAHVEISDDGQEWQSLGAALPVFRQFGAEQLRLPLNAKPATFVRITLDDFRSRPVLFTGVKLLRSTEKAAPPTLVSLGARIAQREEFAGETVLTVTLDGRHAPLAALAFETKEPLFMRRVTVAVREANGGVPTERIVGTGTIYRVALDGAPPRAQLELPLDFTPLSRELLVHLHNGDSAPLAVDGLQVKQHAINLLFLAPAAGPHFLLSGNPQVVAPRYDLAAFAGEMRGAGASAGTPGAIEPMPDYHPRESLGSVQLPDVPLAGAPLDAKDWPQRQPVQIARTGVQELELNLSALAQTRPDFADLRLLRGEVQIPYVLEQPALSRSLSIEPAGAPDAKRPTVSVWRISLPQSGLPLRRLILTSTTPLFQRQFRIYEKSTNQNGGAIETIIAAGSWSRTPEPGVPENRIFELSDRPRSDTLWIETDNGDNPAIALGNVQLVYPVVRLIFKVAETDGFSLAYGNRKASAPRYDLSLVAGKLLTASRQIAQLPADKPIAARASESNPFAGINNTHVFWSALALVVVVLLAVVAKLLPKPPGA